MSLLSTVQELLQAYLNTREDLFLVDLDVDSNAKITVVIDGDQGVTVEDCIAISRSVEHNLDREEQDFELSVFSSGVSQGIQLPRQYHKNKGRKLKVRTKEDITYEGVLTDVSDNGILLEWKTREPKAIGKGKVTVLKVQQIPFDQVAKAEVLITF